MKNTHGHSLIEFLLAIMIASILILTIGTLSTIGNSSYKKLNSQQQIYNDLSYAFKLLQNKVRVAKTLTLTNQPSPWISGKHFLIDAAIFGLYQTNASTVDLVYDNGVQRQTILSVPQPGTITLTFPSPGVTSNSVKIEISGTKDNINFVEGTTVRRRNP